MSSSITVSDPTDGAVSGATAAGVDAAPVAPARGGNISGRARALTLLTPVRPAWTPFLWLVMKTARLHPVFRGHSLQFDFIYFVRWALFRDFPGGGRGREPERKRYHYLLFESNFDIAWQQYIDAFAYVIPRDIRVIWGRGFAFPGPPPAEPLKAWIARNSMEGGHFYAAYPDASVKMVLSALAIRDRCDALSRDAAQLSPEQFREGFQQLVSDVQAHL